MAHRRSRVPTSECNRSRVPTSECNLQLCVPSQQTTLNTPSKNSAQRSSRCNGRRSLRARTVPPRFRLACGASTARDNCQEPSAGKHKRQRQRLRQRKCKTASTSSPLCGLAAPDPHRKEDRQGLAISDTSGPAMRRSTRGGPEGSSHPTSPPSTLYPMRAPQCT